MIDWLRRKWALYWLLQHDAEHARVEARLRQDLRDAERWLGIQRVDET